ncbi:hypothetical protein PR202_gb01286 [Eleusine coracana subsp. coracana]|uniref:non-specific serine/threonine protein kinase n=1 Tax=Eleusine coracana subsp. coracana TaxID=191504 RepID=A0AAV5DUS0_ELECO|nr:hypothetical protein PR202_gb01286 [Eleusine coracana subsp. coracana]
MPAPAVLKLVVLLVLLARPPSTAGAGNATAEACPLDLGYVRTFPWDPSPCGGGTQRNMTACCQTLLSVLAIGIAGRLRATGRFRLPSASASAACLDRYADELAGAPLDLPGSSLVPACFPSPDQFAITPSYCAGVTTVADFRATAGNDAVAALDSACGPDLTASQVCLPCLNAGIGAAARLTTAAGNDSKSAPCFYLTVLYAAGVANKAGPTYPPTAACALGLGLSSPPSNSSKSKETATIYATTIPIVFILLLASVLLAFFLWRKRRHDANSKKKKGSTERRSHPRPNTGSILFDIGELAKATGGFAERNLIGRGGFGAVYRGVLAGRLRGGCEEDAGPGRGGRRRGVHQRGGDHQPPPAPQPGAPPRLLHLRRRRRGRQAAVPRLRLHAQRRARGLHLPRQGTRVQAAGVDLVAAAEHHPGRGAGARVPALRREAGDLPPRHQGHQHPPRRRPARARGGLRPGPPEPGGPVPPHHARGGDARLPRPRVRAVRPAHGEERRVQLRRAGAGGHERAPRAGHDRPGRARAHHRLGVDARQGRPGEGGARRGDAVGGRGGGEPARRGHGEVRARRDPVRARHGGAPAHH